MRSSDRSYRSFEDFERDELRRFQASGVSVDEMIDSIFGRDADSDSRGARASGWDDDDDDDE